jgi:AAA family ATP:ADP antiporter
MGLPIAGFRDKVNGRPRYARRNRLVMLGSVVSLRSNERRPTAIAFLFLTALIASHALLETARDALFLARLPATQLPVVYLAIAGASLLIARVESRFRRWVPQRFALVIWTLLAALGTAIFWLFLPQHRESGSWSRFGLYALYIWTGIIAALVLLHFWSRLADAVSVTQAKRLYPLIGSGSVVGALLGSALASAIARYLGAQPLLLAAAIGFALSAALASFTQRYGFGTGAGMDFGGPIPQADPVLDVQPLPAADSGAERDLARDTRLAGRDPYVRRIAWLVIASAASLTLLDFAFKSSLAASVPAADLGTYFGGVALGLNLLSLVCQVTLAPFVFKRFNLSVALAALPALLVLSGAGLLAGLGLYAALLGKAADGSLRYSLHRTATELLYVPLPDRVRPRIKSVLDVVGQRAGQAIASLAILGLASTRPASLASLPLAALFCLLALIWLGSAIDLRRHYVALLRNQLRDSDPMRSQAFPELDLASLETLVTALDSRDDNEVLAALDVLEREHKARLVPALILYHPAEAVVLRALALFARARRSDVVHVVDRLLEQGPVRVRCDAVAARSLLAPDPRLLFQRLSLEDSPDVRATIVVHLIASGHIAGAEAAERIDEVLKRGRTTTRCALATAISWRTDHAFDRVLVQLAAAPEVDVRVAAIAAMTQSPSPAFIPALVDALGSERTRTAARRALVAQREAGFEAVTAALRDGQRRASLRWELPRTLAEFDPEDALPVLLSTLTEERDGMLRFRTIRALETLVAKHPTVNADPRTLNRVITDTVARAYRLLDARLSLERGAQLAPARATAGHELLVHVLHAKQRNAIGRVLRLLGLAHPAADLAEIRRGLRSGMPKLVANSVELLGSLLEQPLRGAVLGLVEELPDGERLVAAGTYHRPARRNYEAQLEQLLSGESPAVQDFTAFHVAELGLTQLSPLIAALAEADPSRGDLTRALTRLGPAIRGDGELVPC